MQYLSFRSHARALLSLLLAALLTCLLLGTAASAAPSTPPSPAASGASAPAAPGVGVGGESAATTVGVRTATNAAPDARGSYSYEIPPSGFQTDYLAISNYSEHPVDVRVLAEDATSSVETPYAPVTSTDQHGVGAWVLVVGGPAVNLPARTQKIIRFQVSVPHDAQPGDHPGAIVVSLLANEPKPAGGQVVVDHRVGVRMALRVPGELKPKLAVAKLAPDFTGLWAPFGFGRTRVSYTVVNEGNITLSGAQAATLARDLIPGDIRLKVADLPEILPGGSLQVKAQSKFMTGIGPIEARVRVVAKSATAGVPLPTASASATTWAIPWAWLVLLLLIIAAWFARRWWLKRKARKAEQARAAAEAAGVSLPGSRAKRPEVKSKKG